MVEQPMVCGCGLTSVALMSFIRAANQNSSISQTVLITRVEHTACGCANHAPSNEHQQLLHNLQNDTDQMVFFASVGESCA